MNKWKVGGLVGHPELIRLGNLSYATEKEALAKAEEAIKNWPNRIQQLWIYKATKTVKLATPPITVEVIK